MIGLNLGSANAWLTMPHGLFARYSRHCPVSFKSFSIRPKRAAFIAAKTLWCFATSSGTSTYAVLEFRINSEYFLNVSPIFKSNPELAPLMTYQHELINDLI